MSEARRQAESPEETLRNVAPDNPVAVTRKVAQVARNYRPKTRFQSEALRFAAMRGLRPFFETHDMDPAKATAWTVVDPDFGNLKRHQTSTPTRVPYPPTPSGRPDSASTSWSHLVRHRPDPSAPGWDGRDNQDEGVA